MKAAQMVGIAASVLLVLVGGAMLVRSTGAKYEAERRADGVAELSPQDVERFEVPGGWIYHRSSYWGVFVPDPGDE